MSEYSENTLKKWADEIAEKYSLPKELFRSLINVESGWKPYARSSTGAIGLTQLTSVIYKSQQYKTNPYNVKQNLDTGARFLADLHKQYNGNWYDALSHYNAGFNLDSGREYALKVMAGAGIDVTDYIKNFPPSLTPILDKYKPVKGSGVEGDELELSKQDGVIKTKIKEFLSAVKGENNEEKISDFFAKNLKKILVFIIALILLWFGFKKFIKV